MKIRFLADANLNQKIVSGLLLREPQIDFALPQSLIKDGTEDLSVLSIAAAYGRVIVTHDQKTMPQHFGDFFSIVFAPESSLCPSRWVLGRRLSTSC